MLKKLFAANTRWSNGEEWLIRQVCACLGKVSFNNNEFSKASRYFREVLRIDPTHVEAKKYRMKSEKALEPLQLQVHKRQRLSVERDIGKK